MEFNDTVRIHVPPSPKIGQNVSLLCEWGWNEEDKQITFYKKTRENGSNDSVCLIHMNASHVQTKVETQTYINRIKLPNNQSFVKGVIIQLLKISLQDDGLYFCEVEITDQNTIITGKMKQMEVKGERRKRRKKKCIVLDINLRN